jgi:hypothetical protein
MRMKRTIHAGIAAAAAAVAFTACNADKLTSANNNPNSPVDAPSTALFTNAARNGVGRWEDGVGGTRYAFLAQHLAEVQYPDDDAYTRLKASSTSGLFNSSYSNELEDLEIVRRRGLAANDPAMWGPATVLQTWEFGILTDVFGDIPYSQAFKADSGILTPAYDTQQSIYADIFARLTAASAALGGTTANDFGSSDPIYHGVAAQWQKFANSLRARHAMRLINVDPATANTQLTAALSDPAALILTNADNAKLVWPGDGIYDSPWANNFKTRDDHRISTRLITYLAQWNDPRTPIYAMPAQKDTVELKDTTEDGVITSVTKNYCPTAGTCYVGLGNALTQAIASPLVPYTSRPGAIFYPGQTSYGVFGGAGKSFPSYLMTAAEVEFIRAEAAERGIGGLNAAQAAGFYNAGITRSMEMWGVDPAAIATYLAQPGVAYAGTTVEKQKQIAIQKWIALYTDPIQAWSNFRRTCQPAIVRPGPYAVETAIPRRLYYSTTEKAVNAANVAAAVARQGADNFRTRIYWDTKPNAAPTIETGCGVSPAI